MRRENIDVDVKNLCSRKLYELCATTAVGQAELKACVEELQSRQHYLDQLSRLGKRAQLVPAHMMQRH